MTRFRAHLRDVSLFRRLSLIGLFTLLCTLLLTLAISSAPSPSLPHSSVLPFISFSDSTRDSTKNPFLFPPQLNPVDSLSRRHWIDSVRAYRDSLGLPPLDSLGFRTDTTAEKIDTTWIVYHDSTARLEQLAYRRADQPAVELFPHNNYNLFLQTRSSAYQRELKLDSTGKLITVREMVNGSDVKVPVTMTLEEYIHQRYTEEKLNNWRTFTREYTIKQNQDQLGGFLSNLANIEIPVPANPLLSIFGKPSINLHVSGAVDIRAAFRATKSDQVALNTLDVSRNEPDFNQQVQVNVNGTIGDKLNILADWNTQRTFEYENALKIKYTGYEDEIVQSVEAGNVSLQTPSLVGGGQALFGLKARFQVGPLMLTTLLSQKKGQTHELAVQGGQQASAQDIFPHQYSKSYYFVDTVYRQYWETLHQGTVINASPDMFATQIIAIDVWQSVTTSPAQDRRVVKGLAYIDLPYHFPTDETYPSSPYIDSTFSKDPGKQEDAYFIKLDPNKDYKFADDRQKYGGYIIMNTNVSDDQVLAVTYTIAGPQGQTRTYGSLSVKDTITGGRLLLKLIKPKALSTNPSWKPAWDLQLKNIYPLGGRDLKQEGFSLEMFRRNLGTDTKDLYGQPLLKVFGLDRYSSDNQPTPDNVFDFIRGLTIDVERAEIIFPTLRPFDSTIIRYFQNISPPQPIADSLLFGAVYDTTVTAAQNDLIKNRYYMHVVSSSAVSSRYSLGFNVVEGSVHVLLNGGELKPNTDYTVDYIVGEVILKAPEALLPGANVQIKFEQNDLFQLASKTLIGARGELNLFPNTNLGFTAMNLSQATLSDKVRLGEEPTSNLMLGVDGSTSFNLPFLTAAIDALPLLRTREMSSIRMSAEAAYSIPDPNTKKSTLPSDQNVSVAYLDDFEGARRTIPIDISDVNWRLTSPPVFTLLGQNIDDSDKVFSKARLLWYNNVNGFENTVVKDIWPLRSVRTGQEFTRVLYLDYDPNHRGMYNLSPKLDSTLHRQNLGPNTNTGQFDNAAERSKNWNGIIRYIAPYAGSILDQNVGYLELWMQVYDRGDPNLIDSADRRNGKLYIDLGRISEDVIPNRQLNSEDIIPTANNPNGIPHGVVNEENDFGLDMRSDAQEITDYRNTFLSTNIHGGVLDPDIDPNDPSGDNFFYQTGVYNFSKYNGPEGNYKGNASNGRFPNTEDLNNNGTVDLDNQYAEYEIPVGPTYIDSNSNLVNNQLIVGGNPSKGWYQFRIPLQQANRVINGNSVQSILQNVQYMRMWVSGFSKPVVLRIAEIDLVGNQWQELTRNDSIMKISVVNVEDNPGYNSDDYNRLGIVRERDKTQPNENIFANEQSLSLILNGLPLDSSREAVKYFPVRPLDVFNYKSMKMFVHGDQAFSYIDTNNYDARIYLRFGADTANFYEYSQPVRPGWDPANEISISFAELTAIKATRDSINTLYHVPVVNGPPTATYGVKGNPSLRQIRYIGIGISNPRLSAKQNTLPLRGQVWVNELRLVDVDNASGYAYRFDTQIKLADFGSVAINYNRTSPSFHGLEQRFGDQNDRTNWSLSSSLDLTKFFPDSWQGTAVSVSYSHGENLVKPKYLPNSDVVVTEAASRAAERIAAGANTTVTPDKIITESQSLHVQDSYALTNLRIAPPIQAWYIRDTFSKLSFGFNYNSSRDRDPATEIRRIWGWNVSANYAVTLPGDYFIQPFKNIFNGIFLLNEFKEWKFYYMPIMNLSASIGAQRSHSVEVSRFAGSQTRDTRGFSVGKRLGFGWKLTEGGLTGLSGDYGLSTERSLLNLDNDSVGRSLPSILKSILFRGTDSRYTQRVTFNMKPKLPNIFDLTKFLDLTASYGVNYNWQNTFQQEDLGKSAGFDNSISFGMNLRLKALTDPWFQQSAETEPPPQDPARDEEKKSRDNDSTASKDQKKTDPPGRSKNIFNNIKSIGKLLIKIPFLDYESIGITFSQNNRAVNSGILGSTGFQNFWRFPWQGSLVANGPSRLYQLGLISDPSGRLRYSPSSSFPFIGWRTEHGLRAPNGQLTDQYGQSNNIGLRTTRPLWDGASLAIDWKVGWQFNKTTTITTDSLGNPTPGITTTAGSVERSYLSLPPILFFKVFKSNLEDVGKKYDKLIAGGESPNAALAESFERGLEALPFLNKVFGSFVPRPNWTLRWDGIEKIAGISSVVDRLSLEHAYQSSFRRDFRGGLDGSEQTDQERVTFGFAPLAAVNATFKEFLKGNLTGNLKMNSNTIYDLNLSAQNIVETFSQEMSISFTYARRGFKLPLFGLNLNNDVDMSFTFSRTKNTRRQYQPQYLSQTPEGTPLDGNTRTTMEPRLRYTLSSRVSAALYYRYSRIAPDEGASTVFGTTTNEAGVDLHITFP